MNLVEIGKWNMSDCPYVATESWAVWRHLFEFLSLFWVDICSCQQKQGEERVKNRCTNSHNQVLIYQFTATFDLAFLLTNNHSLTKRCEKLEFASIWHLISCLDPSAPMFRKTQKSWFSWSILNRKRSEAGRSTIEIFDPSYKNTVLFRASDPNHSNASEIHTINQEAYRVIASSVCLPKKTNKQKSPLPKIFIVRYYRPASWRVCYPTRNTTIIIQGRNRFTVEQFVQENHISLRRSSCR